MFGTHTVDNLPDRFFYSHKAWDAYMAGPWHGLFELLKIDNHGTIVEIAPGNSVKIALALAKAGFQGKVYLVEPVEDILAEVSALYREILPGTEIHPLCHMLDEVQHYLPHRPSFIVANHPLDDMILATAQPKSRLGELFGWTAIAQEQTITLSLESWENLAAEPDRLVRVRERIRQEWNDLLRRLQPEHCIISQYPSVTLENHGMAGLNREATAIFAALHSDYTGMRVSDLVIQAVLNKFPNYNDRHIGQNVLNAVNWLVF